MGVVQDIDKGWNNFVKQVGFFSKHEVVFGWIDGKKERRGSFISNAELATVHEYGTVDGNIPEGRLGLRTWVDSHQSEISDHIEDAYKASIPRGDAKKELNKLGLWATAEWRRWQRDTQPGPPWSDATVRIKEDIFGEGAVEGSKKLVDTGQLLNAVTHAIRERGETFDL